MIVFWRVLLALPVSVGVAYATGGRLSWGLVRQAALIGICFAISIIASFTSFRETSIANATLIPALQPALVLVVRGADVRRTPDARRHRLRDRRRSSASRPSCSRRPPEDNSMYGDLLAVVNLLVFTIYFLLAKHVRTGNVHSWSFLATIFVITAFVVTPWAIAVDGGVTRSTRQDWLLVMAIVLGAGDGRPWVHHLGPPLRRRVGHVHAHPRQPGGGDHRRVAHLLGVARRRCRSSAPPHVLARARHPRARRQRGARGERPRPRSAATSSTASTPSTTWTPSTD